jgi:hypothetical protein
MGCRDDLPHNSFYCNFSHRTKKKTLNTASLQFAYSSLNLGLKQNVIGRGKPPQMFDIIQLLFLVLVAKKYLFG